MRSPPNLRKDNDVTSRAWLITGVSSGFGRELATQLLDRGEVVVGTVRRPDSVADLVRKYPDRFHRELLDVTDAAAVRDVTDRSFTSLGRIDVVVRNAGYGLFGAAEELSDEQVGSRPEGRTPGRPWRRRAGRRSHMAGSGRSPGLEKDAGIEGSALGCYRACPSHMAGAVRDAARRRVRKWRVAVVARLRVGCKRRVPLGAPMTRLRRLPCRLIRRSCPTAGSTGPGTTRT
jgi:hypothetical protein